MPPNSPVGQEIAKVPDGRYETEIGKARVAHFHAALDLRQVTFGGFDNHAGEDQDHDDLLKTVSDGIKALFDDLDGGAQSLAEVDLRRIDPDGKTRVPHGLLLVVVDSRRDRIDAHRRAVLVHQRDRHRVRPHSRRRISPRGAPL